MAAAAAATASFLDALRASRYAWAMSSKSSCPPDILAALAARAVARLASCDLCPRRCGVNRLEDATGLCGVGRQARVASAMLHVGEEAPLVGRGGSGTIFFAGCNLGCCFCQNADIAFHPEEGQAVSPAQLAACMLALQEQGAENINFTAPQF